jgi:serine/threonine-protein kinase HipA
MRNARISVNGKLAGILQELGDNKYRFIYEPNYQGPPISLTTPLTKNTYEFHHFPPFFEGLLPEGAMLDALLRKYKLDKNDYFGQLLKIGQDTVGAVTIEELK